MPVMYSRPASESTERLGWSHGRARRGRTGAVMAEREGSDEREVELRMALLREWYGDRFREPEQEREVRARVAEELARVSAVLRAAAVEPGHEPFPPFTPYRGDR